MKVDYSITLPSDLGAQARRELTRILENHATAINRHAFETTHVAAATTVAHDLVLCSTGGSTLSITLLPTIDWEDLPIRIKKVDSGSGPVVVAGQSGETIDGAASKTISGQYSSIQLVSAGAVWHVV